MSRRRAGELESLVDDILCGGVHFLEGVNGHSPSLLSLLTAVRDWGVVLGRELEEIAASIEPLLRQSILMSLLPAKAFDEAYSGSIDAAVDEHLANLGVQVSATGRARIRNMCINMQKLRGMSSREARSRTYTLALVKGAGSLYSDIRRRQRGRCLWCGVRLDEPYVRETLEHVVPKHLGDDMPDGSNWGIACASCNAGKGDVLAWPASGWAHDYVARNDVTSGREIMLSHRWSVLRRSPRCDYCRAGPLDKELSIYRRIATGLAVPANCSTACLDCIEKKGVERVQPRWAPEESGRP